MDQPLAEIYCWFCDARSLLDTSVAVRMAETHTFVAAHSAHWEGVGVSVDIYPAGASRSE